MVKMLANSLLDHFSHFHKKSETVYATGQISRGKVWCGPAILSFVKYDPAYPRTIAGCRSTFARNLLECPKAEISAMGEHY